MNRRLVAIALAFTGALMGLLGGCNVDSRTDVVLVNRSAASLAFAPGVLISPCGEGAYSTDELRAAGEQLLDLSQNSIIGDELAWVPEGAVVVEVVPPSEIGAPVPEYYVISGTKQPYVEYGALNRQLLPICSGQPILTGAKYP